MSEKWVNIDIRVSPKRDGDRSMLELVQQAQAAHVAEQLIPKMDSPKAAFQAGSLLTFICLRSATVYQY